MRSFAAAIVGCWSEVAHPLSRNADIDKIIELRIARTQAIGFIEIFLSGMVVRSRETMTVYCTGHCALRRCLARPRNNSANAGAPLVVAPLLQLHERGK